MFNNNLQNHWLVGRDVDGRRISCHESCLLQHGADFYWYGTSHVGNPEGRYGPAGRAFQNGFNVYRSQDLRNWQSEGVCLEFTPPDARIRGTAHRPNVLYNEATQTFVMWFFDIFKYPDSLMTVAVADAPTGPFRILGPRRTASPHGGVGQDCGLFKDDDGQAYLVYDDGARNLRIDHLSDDYLETTGTTTIALKPSQEGSAMGKIRGTYIVAGSGVCGWGVSETHCAIADSPLGPYSAKKQISTNKTWGSQISNFLQIRGVDTLVAVCDCWWSTPEAKQDLDASPYLFIPVILNSAIGTVKMLYNYSEPATKGKLA